LKEIHARFNPQRSRWNDVYIFGNQRTLLCTNRMAQRDQEDQQTAARICWLLMLNII